MATISWYQFLHMFESAPFDDQTREVGPTRDRELRALINIAYHFQPLRILELYTSEGYTAMWLARLCPTSEIVAIDICTEMNINPGEFNASNEIKELANVGRAFRNSHEEARIRLIVDNPEKIDFSYFPKFDLAFIDGEHSFSAVLLDTKRALESINHNGVLVWDDYQDACPQIIEFIDKLNILIGDFIFRVESTRICFALLTQRRCQVLLCEIEQLIKVRLSL